MFLTTTEDEKFLTISLVIYNPNLIELKKTLTALVATKVFEAYDSYLFIVDNSPLSEVVVKSVVDDYLLSIPGCYISRPDNPGFGAAHNMSLRIKSKYNLILNPDLEMDVRSLSNAFDFMAKHPECGLLTPYATWENGQVQHLCKRYPSFFVLFLRFFSSINGRRFFERYLCHYEMSDTLNPHNIYWSPPVVSGCFMLFEHEVFSKLSGFDERFFLYFEDFDISLRAGKITKIAYVPEVKVIHHGGHTARKGLKHIKLFLRSMVLFFNIHGWKIL